MYHLGQGFHKSNPVKRLATAVCELSLLNIIRMVLKYENFFVNKCLNTKCIISRFFCVFLYFVLYFPNKYLFDELFKSHHCYSIKIYFLFSYKWLGLWRFLSDFLNKRFADSSYDTLWSQGRNCRKEKWNFSVRISVLMQKV